jgi:hypothetical protein
LAIAAISVVLPLTFGAAPGVAAQAPIGGRPAELRAGTCAGLGEVVMHLAQVVFTVGDPLGQTGATPVEQSGTVVPFTIEQLLASEHAVVVQESIDAAATPVACGVVGGALNPDGTLAVGMNSMNDSSLSGVAYFTPIETFQNTLITILLVDTSSDREIIAVAASDGIVGTSGPNAADAPAEEPGQPQ